MRHSVYSLRLPYTDEESGRVGGIVRNNCGFFHSSPPTSNCCTQDESYARRLQTRTGPMKICRDYGCRSAL